jgi:signal transduction histidine kinase
MNSKESLEDNTVAENEKRKAFITSALAGGAFGLVVGTVFLLMGIVTFPPLPFLLGLSLLTATFSGLSGLGSTYLDTVLKKWGMQNNLLRSAIIFFVIVTVIFSMAWLIMSRFNWGEMTSPLREYAVPGMFLGLVFGIVVAAVTYRMEAIQQKVRLLELENRYLEELAEKDNLLQEAARNLAVAEERNSMARELHDSISQGIHGIVFSLLSLRRQLDSGSKAGEILLHLEETTQETLKELKRLIMELTPSPLEDNSLKEALELQADLFAHRQQTEMKVDLRYDGTLAPEQEVAVYRITQEALANVVQHAHARYVTLSLVSSENGTTYEIKDDGCGFDIGQIKKGNGLQNIATRARQNHGEVDFVSAPNEGTAISVFFPKKLF